MFKCVECRNLFFSYYPNKHVKKYEGKTSFPRDAALALARSGKNVRGPDWSGRVWPLGVGPGLAWPRPGPGPGVPPLPYIHAYIHKYIHTYLRSRILDPGSWIHGWGSWVLDHGFLILDLRFRILDLRFMILDPWSQDPGSWIQDKENWILDQGSRDPGSWILDPGWRLLGWGFTHVPFSGRSQKCA